VLGLGKVIPSGDQGSPFPLPPSVVAGTPPTPSFLGIPFSRTQASNRKEGYDPLWSTSSSTRVPFYPS